MSSDYLELIVLGRVATDPAKDYRVLDNGTAVASFTVAVNRSSKDPQTGQKITREPIWLRVTAFGFAADVAKNYLKKRDKVFLTGRLTADEKGNPPSWKRQDGTVGTAYDVTADVIRVIPYSPKQPEVDEAPAPEEVDETPYAGNIPF